MEALKNKITAKGKELEALVMEIAVKASQHRQYPRYEIGDRLDKAAIYVSAAQTKLCKARDALQE